jgi:hypothetical protein
MTYISEVGKNPENLERLRGEILENIESRREESGSAFSEFSKFSGIVYSGGTIAILSYIASRKDTTVPLLAIASFGCFSISLLSFSLLLYKHFQLQSSRWNLYAEIAHRFFTRKATLEDLISASEELQTTWLYRLMFWLPFSLAAAGFSLGVCAAVVGSWKY